MLKNKYILDPWSIIENKFDSSKMIDSESIFSLGNGKIGQRGNFEEDFSGNQSIGNYISGIYYKDKTKVGWWKKGYPDYFAKMVNCPNWNTIRIEINNNVLDLNKCKVYSYKRELNMKEGWCERNVELETPNKEKIQIISKKFISLKRENIGVIQYSVKPLNKKIKIKILPAINIDVKNNDANWNQPFLETAKVKSNNNYSIVKSKVINSSFEIATFFKTKYFINSISVQSRFSENKNENLIGSQSEFDLNPENKLTLLKIGGYVNSNDTTKDEFENLINKELTSSMDLGFEGLLKENSKAWENIWNDSDIIIDGDVFSQQAVRFNIFQLNQTFNGNDPKLNIGPKGFTGEKYGGVTYWDTEAYCIPFYLGTKNSIVSKNLLLQRYNQLPNAIMNAEKIGLNHGAALYPMVTANGDECHNEWEITFEEIHRNAAIVQAIKKYVNFTDDFDFINKKAVKILIAISRFWSQRVNFSKELNKYVILGVTGPNEYENNVDNNWYTNYSARWCLQYTIEVLNKISESEINTYNKITLETSLEKDEIKKWNEIIEGIYLPFSTELGVFIQNDGFLNKDLVPAISIPENERPINQNWSWDKILRSPYIKQADVLQGFYFFDDDFDDDEHISNFNYYEQFTVHESSLSACIHSILASKINDLDKAYEYFIRASRLDLDDYNKEIKQGLHITSMGGTWMSVVEGFAGLRVKNNEIHFNTKIPKKWDSYSFKVNVKNRKLSIKIDKNTTTISLLDGESISVIINGLKTHLKK